MRVASLVFWLLFSFFGTAHAAREFDVLPQTGQTKCYDSIGNLIACAGTGQDGELKKGIPWPNPRFVDHGNGTITDMLTGLMWLKDTNCAYTIGHNPDNDNPFIGNMSWLNGLDFVKKMNIGAIDACGSYALGHTDWRLPTPRELESLINYGASNNVTWLTGQGFINVKAQQHPDCITDDCPYWTATTYSGLQGSAIAVDVEYDFIYGRSKIFNHWNPSLTWPVRRDGIVLNPPAPVIATGQMECYDENNAPINCSGTGQDGETQQGITWPSERFIDHGDGTVTDVFTNLMWLKSFPTGNATWQYAMNYVGGMNSGVNDNYGYVDWYIPNVHEALSLISWQTHNLAFPPGHPFDMLWGNATWSNTYSFNSIIPGKKDRAAMVTFSHGGEGTGGKTSGGTTYLPVRSLMFRNAVGNFYKKTGKTGGQCVPYVRNETHLPWAACNGPAYQCFSQAQTAGYYTGSIPRVGSIIVFAVQGKMNVGHVGIVAEINGNLLTLRDSNWKDDDEIVREHVVDVSKYIILGYIYP